MPLLQRQSPRPVPRDLGKVRDAALFVVASEDRFAPDQYFSFLISNRIHVVVLGTPHGEGPDASRVVKRLEDFEKQYQLDKDMGDQLWALLDTDHWIEAGHKRNLIEAINSARPQGHRIAMSNPCFDFWLLLHHENVLPSAQFPDAASVAARIRKIVGEFNKTNLKKEHYPPVAIQQAINRAKALDAHGGSAPASKDFWPSANGSRVYLLMEELQRAGLKLA